MRVLAELRPAEGVIGLKTDFEMRDVELIKKVPGAKYRANFDQWTTPLTWGACRALRGIFKDDLEIGPDLAAWAWDVKVNRIDPAMALRNAWEADGDADLYPYQRAGVKFLTVAKKALLCDEMGTGKTVQTIRTLANIAREGGNPFPALVVCPNNMTLTWKKEIEKWWPGVSAIVVKGSALQRRKLLSESSHVKIINFEGLKAHSRLAGYGSIRLKRCTNCDSTLADIVSNSPSRCEHCPRELNQMPWKTLVVDEAHRMKDPKAKQTRAIWAVATASTEYIFPLTGTAIADNPVDLWPALHLLDQSEHPSKSKYIDRYCLASFNIFGGMRVIGLKDDTRDEFFDVIDPRMRRMPKEAVLPFLPRKTYSTRYVEMSPKQAKGYKQMSEGMMAEVDGGVAIAGNELFQFTRLLQFSSACAEINEENEVKMAEPSNKVTGLLDLIEDMAGEPLVVFAMSRQLINLAANALERKNITFSMIAGGQTVEEREAAKDSFQAGQVQVILCTIAAGGIGITLTRAATACFMQRSWSMIDNAQAEDRIHRIGAEVHDKIEIIDLVSEGTIEERQRETLALKYDRLEEVMRDKETVARLLGRNDDAPTNKKRK